MKNNVLKKFLITGGGILLVAAFLLLLQSPPRPPSIAPRGLNQAPVAALDFQKEVLDSPLPVLVDFWAPWCGPCRIVSPIIEKIAEKTAGKVKVLKVNVDDHPNIAREYNIRGIPTIMVFKNGAVEETMVGVQSEQTYLNAIGL